MPLAPDPADKLDAAADGAFGGKPVNRRAGYGDRLEMALKFARKGACLSAGEGQLIVEHYEERLAAVEAERDALREQLTYQTITLTAEHQRAERILATLREPSETVVRAATAAAIGRGHLSKAIRAAVAAAEKGAARA